LQKGFFVCDRSFWIPSSIWVFLKKSVLIGFFFKNFPLRFSAIIHPYSNGGPLQLHVWCIKLVWAHAQVPLGAAPLWSSGLKSLWRVPNRAWYTIYVTYWSINFLLSCLQNTCIDFISGERYVFQVKNKRLSCNYIGLILHSKYQ
jgi:hypothetical protein